MTDESEMLAIQAATRFSLTESGLLVRENSPEGEPAPRMWLSGSSFGNALRLRDDVGEHTARVLSQLAADEPPLADAHSEPVHTEEYVHFLEWEGPVSEVSRDVTYTIPHCCRYKAEVNAEIISSIDTEGSAFLQRVKSDGMPLGLASLGFVDATHLWEPWCILLDGDDPMSIAFAARLSERGAEIGVATPPEHRGRGYAAAATAAWSSLAPLADHVLFYSTSRANVSSQRVAERLALNVFGASLSIY